MLFAERLKKSSATDTPHRNKTPKANKVSKTVSVSETGAETGAGTGTGITSSSVQNQSVTSVCSLAEDQKAPNQLLKSSLRRPKALNKEHRTITWGQDEILTIPEKRTAVKAADLENAAKGIPTETQLNVFDLIAARIIHKYLSQHCGVYYEGIFINPIDNMVFGNATMEKDTNNFWINQADKIAILSLENFSAVMQQPPHYFNPINDLKDTGHKFILVNDQLTTANIDQINGLPLFLKEVNGSRETLVGERAHVYLELSAELIGKDSPILNDSFLFI